MIINNEMLDYISRLSKIEINDSEKEKVKNEMEKILEYMEKLENIDTEGVEALSHNSDIKNVFREDVAKESRNREEILSNAAKKNDNAFVVPKTFE